MRNKKTAKKIIKPLNLAYPVMFNATIQELGGQIVIKKLLILGQK